MSKVQVVVATIMALICAVSPAFAGGPLQMLVSIDTGTVWPGQTSRWNVAWACMGAPAADEPYDPAQQAGWTYVALADPNNNKCTGLNLDPTSNLSWTGYIWSNINETRNTVYVKFQVGDPLHQYKWGLNIFYPDGTPFTSSVFNGSEYSTMMPIITTSDWRNGLMFNVTASTVPEPGSMIAMLSGLIGLGGAFLRRRK